MGIFLDISRKRSLNLLSALDNSRLSDLGLNRYDLFEARNVSSAKLGGFLSQRRSERAHYWLR